MRVLSYLLTVVVSTALTLGAALLVALQLHDAPAPLLIAAATGTLVLVMGPVLVGGFAGYFDHRASVEGRRYLRRWFLGVVVLDVVAAGFVVAASVTANAPLWVPAVLVVGAAVLLVAARPLGSLFRRTEAPIADTVDGLLPGRDAIRRKVVRIAVTFVVAAVLATIGVVLAVVLWGERGTDLGQVVLLAGQLTFLAPAVAALVVALPISRALRDVGGRDVGRLRRYAQVVLRGKRLELDPAERPAAVQYARIVPLALQFQLAYLGLLYLSIAFQLLSSVVRGSLVPVPAVTIVLLVLVLAWVVPTTVRHIRRARRYAAAHAADVTDPAAVGP
ncbi:hypothetical protein [Curtobacterium sp. L1-20]|uniref:hypothetical protein n=1 Tax=Curtobacterium sp. L1-20 TaxID=3138181 RepID=UPI003B520767